MSRKPKHILELDVQRGISLWLDGKRPDKEWSYGEDSLNDNDSFVSSDLTVDGVRISKVRFHHFGEGMPKIGASVSAVIGGKLFKGKIARALTGDSEAAHETKFVLHNGKRHSVDETHLYVKIYLTKQV